MKRQSHADRGAPCGRDCVSLSGTPHDNAAGERVVRAPAVPQHPPGQDPNLAPSRRLTGQIRNKETPLEGATDMSPNERPSNRTPHSLSLPIGKWASSAARVAVSSSTTVTVNNLTVAKRQTLVHRKANIQVFENQCTNPGGHRSTRAVDPKHRQPRGRRRRLSLVSQQSKGFRDAGNEGRRARTTGCGRSWPPSLAGSTAGVAAAVPWASPW